MTTEFTVLQHSQTVTTAHAQSEIQRMMSIGSNHEQAVADAIVKALRDYAFKPDADAKWLAGVLDVSNVANEWSQALAKAEARDEEMLKVIDERDEAEDSLGDAYAYVTGRVAEWSSLFGYDEATNEMSEHVHELMAQIEELKAKAEAPPVRSEWRSVDDELPKHEQFCLVQKANGAFDVGMWFVDRWEYHGYYENGHPRRDPGDGTYWKPLDAPPVPEKGTK